MDFEKLPSNWKWCTILELVVPNTRAIVSGPFGSNIGSRFFVEHGIPVIRGNNLTQDLRKFTDSGFVFVTPEKAKELGHVDAIEDDLIFTAAGTLGQVGIIPVNSAFKKYIISNKQLRVRIDKKKIIPLFAFYWFSSAKMVEYIQQQNTGSTIPLINLSILKKLPIPVPDSLDEQIEIVNILSSIDRKIELNQHMNETLEAIAQALFKSWFVDFDPVKAKVQGHKPESMDVDTAALFPSAFTEFILGPIPEGWNICSLGDFIELAYGKALKAISRIEGFVPVYGSNGQIGWHDTALVKGPGVVVGRKGNPGTVIYVHEDFFPIDTTFFVIPSQRVPSIIFLDMLMERLSLPNLSADSAVPGLNRTAAYSAQCILPPLNLIKNFDEHISPFILKKKILQDENKRLIEIRDLLLPRLMSGKLRIEDEIQ